MLLRERLAGLVSLQKAARRRSGEKAVEWLNRSGLAERPRLSQKLKVSRRWRGAVELVLGDFVEATRVDGLASLARADELAPGLMLVEGGEASAEDGTLLGKVRGAGAAAGWLATVRTAPDVSTALSMIADLGKGESVITPQGVWLGRGWLRVAGRKGEGALEREEEIAALRKVLEDTGRLCGAGSGYSPRTIRQGRFAGPPGATQRGPEDRECRTGVACRPQARCGPGHTGDTGANCRGARAQPRPGTPRGGTPVAAPGGASVLRTHRGGHRRYRRTDRSAEDPARAVDRGAGQGPAKPEILAQTQTPYRPKTERGPEVARTSRRHAGRGGIGTRGNPAPAGREAGTTRRGARGAKGNRG